LHAIDVRVVHVAMRRLTYPRNRAGEKALPRDGLWGGVRLRVAEFLANLWQHTASPRCADPVDACRADAGRALTRNRLLAFLAMLVVAAPSIYDAATVAAATRVTPSFS
jgi:hypothetical protein